MEVVLHPSHLSVYRPETSTNTRLNQAHPQEKVSSISLIQECWAGNLHFCSMIHTYGLYLLFNQRQNLTENGIEDALDFCSNIILVRPQVKYTLSISSSLPLGQYWVDVEHSCQTAQSRILARILCRRDYTFALLCRIGL